MLHLLRDFRTITVVLVMPVVLLLLFGFAISTEVNNVNVAVVASRPSETIRQAVTRIEANPYFTLRGFIPASDIDRTLRAGDADAVVVFADDYDRRTADPASKPDGKPAVQLIMDASNTNTAAAGAGYLRQLLTNPEAFKAAPETRLLFNPQMKSAYNFVPGIMGLIFILICAILTSVSIVREKETGTMEVLLVSPVRPLRIMRVVISSRKGMSSYPLNGRLKCLAKLSATWRAACCSRTSTLSPRSLLLFSRRPPGSRIPLK